MNNVLSNAFSNIYKFMNKKKLSIILKVHWEIDAHLFAA